MQSSGAINSVEKTAREGSATHRSKSLDIYIMSRHSYQRIDIENRG
jgi:hypothetical protein